MKTPVHLRYVLVKGIANAHLDSWKYLGRWTMNDSIACSYSSPNLSSFPLQLRPVSFEFKNVRELVQPVLFLSVGIFGNTDDETIFSVDVKHVHANTKH